MFRTSRNTTTLTLSLILLSLTPVLAQTTIYSTGFESPSFANGSILAGQDGWVSIGIASPNAASISNTAANSGNQGVRVRGADLVDDPAFAPYFAAGSFRRPVNYFANGMITLVSSDVFVSGPQSAPSITAPFFGATVASRLFGPNGGDTYEFQLSSEGVFYGFDDNLSNSPVADPGVLPRIHADVNRWYNMGIRSDFNAKTVTFLLDGSALGVVPFSDPFDTLLRGALVVYASPSEPGFSRTDYAARFDNFRISAVPEPGAVAMLLGMTIPGGLFLLRRRARK